MKSQNEDNKNIDTKNDNSNKKKSETDSKDKTDSSVTSSAGRRAPLGEAQPAKKSLKTKVFNSNAVEAKGLKLFQDLVQEAASKFPLPFLQKLASDKFKKNGEGTLANVYIYEDTKDDDRKVRCLKIAVTQKKCETRNIYQFSHLKRGKYKNCLILCIALDSKKIWWLENDSKHLSNSKGGTLNMSQKKLEAIENDGCRLVFTNQESIKRFENAYNNLLIISKVKASEPVSPTAKKEKICTEQYLKSDSRIIESKYPESKNGVTDLEIRYDKPDNKFSNVQTKTLQWQRKELKDGGYSVVLRCMQFSKSLAGTQNTGKQCYESGDNDFYVFLVTLWEDGKKSLEMTKVCAWFTIPEKELIAQNLVVEEGGKGRMNFMLYPPKEHRRRYGITENPRFLKRDRDKDDPTKHWTEKFYYKLK